MSANNAAVYEWKRKLGEYSFCSLGFQAFGKSAEAGPGDGGPNHTFCRVYPGYDLVGKVKVFQKGANGKAVWYIKSGSADKIPVACHAVCLK
jgi:hypothetical protein